MFCIHHNIKVMYRAALNTPARQAVGERTEDESYKISCATYSLLCWIDKYEVRIRCRNKR